MAVKPVCQNIADREISTKTVTSTNQLISGRIKLRRQRRFYFSDRFRGTEKKNRNNCQNQKTGPGKGWNVTGISLQHSLAFRARYDATVSAHDDAVVFGHLEIVFFD